LPDNENAPELARAEQGQRAKKATRERMKKKKPREKKFTVQIGDELLEYRFRAIGGKAYDKLVNECPATTEQLSRGLQVDQDKLAPKLLSRVCVDPEMSEDEWAEFWNDESYSRGELLTLYNEAGMLNLQGFDVTPIAAD